MTEHEMIEDYKKELCEHGNYHCVICEVKLLKKVIEEQKLELQLIKQGRSFCPFCWELISGNIEEHIRNDHPDGGGA